jgi:hypothetical protein
MWALNIKEIFINISGLNTWFKELEWKGIGMVIKD